MIRLPKIVSLSLVALLSLLWLSPLQAADIKVLESDRLRKQRGAQEEATPASFLRRIERERALRVEIDENIEEQIATLQLLIDSADEEDTDLPKYLLTLGDVYWEKADSFYDQAYDLTLEKEIYDARIAEDEATVESKLAIRDVYLKSEQRWRERAIQVYRSIENRFAAYPSLDMVFYYLGSQYNQLGRREEGFEYFRKIMERFPASKYVPDALFHSGDYFFDANQFDVALQFYEKVEDFPKSVAYAMALHKQGWCYYNMADYEESLKRFLRVIVYAKSEEAQSLPFRLELEKEARKDLVRSYAAVGTAKRALKFFNRIAPDLKFELAETLAQTYFNDGHWQKSSIVYELLLKNDVRSPNRAFHWLGLAENAYHEGNKQGVRDTVRSLMQEYREVVQRLTPSLIKEANERLEGVIKTAASNYHKEADKYGTLEAIESTTYLYQAYLALFPNADDAYDVSWNLALLNEQIGRWDEAARLYEAVIEMKPEGAHAAGAAKAILLAYFKVVQNERSEEKDDAEINLEPMPYPEKYLKVQKSAVRFIDIAGADDPEISKAHYVLAQISYRFNHFDEAIGHLDFIVKSSPEDELVNGAGRMLLSCFGLKRDVDSLERYADQFYNNPRTNQGDLAVVVRRIRNQTGFNRCFKFEQSKEFVKSARCFLAYVEEFPDTELRSKAFFNAAAAFNRAKLVEKALETLQQLYNAMPNDSLAPTALYSIAEIYRSLVIYSESARFYEFYAQRHPKHKYVKKALQRAYLFRRALGEPLAAIKVGDMYRKLFPKDEVVPGLLLDRGILYREANKRRDAMRAFEAIIRKPPGGVEIVLKARLELGRTLSAGVKRDKNRARQIFLENVKKFNEMPEDERRRLSKDAIAAVAESHFLVGEMILRDMAAIELKGSVKAITKALQKKLELIVAASEVLFKQVSSYGQKNWAIAGISRTGQAYEKFADDVQNAAVPKKLRGDAREIYRQDMAERAQPFRQAAIENYRRAIDLAISQRWVNTYTQDALSALGRLDYEFQYLKEYSVPMGQIRGTGAVPMIGSFLEAEDAGLLATPTEEEGQE
jgi:tetratricopeptide (TPR) repeat protein